MDDLESKGEHNEAPWEDWDEDQRRALGQSHKRTMGSLENSSAGAGRTAFSADRRESSVQKKSAQTQILPTDKELSMEAEKAKQRKNVEEEKRHKARQKRITITCVMFIAILSSIVGGFVALALFVPEETTHGGKEKAYNAHKEQPPSRPEGETMTASMLRTVQKFIDPLVERQRKTRQRQKMLFPDYAQIAVIMGDGNWMPPRFEGLYSHVEVPLIDIQPVLWMTPRSGSRTLMDILTYCGKLVLASDIARGHDASPTLEIFSTPDNLGHYANVDPTTCEGIDRAEQLGAVESELIHVVATPLLAEASRLFENKMRTGRVFALFRHPVEEALSDFRWRRELPPSDPQYIPPEMTLGKFVESPNLVTNSMTKLLANITDDSTISDAQVMVAKKVVHERLLVGLTDSYDESVLRFFDYFGWSMHDSSCPANFRAARDTRLDHPPLQEKSQEHKTLADRNWADVEVYEFAREVFMDQRHVSKRLH
mmetsp:Transcript_31213/g.44313  ORF Transcript_31213/g.44313 Transcript_31213/m.44313 type:complete len:483 (-) Transcript_31213:891-2339(-)